MVVLSVTRIPKGAAVYNLTVAGEHEYFANGLLVGNCDALRYASQGLDYSATGGIHV